MARQKLHVDRPLPGDVTRAPSAAENEAALRAKGWISDGRGPSIDPEKRPPRPPSARDQFMRERGFRKVGERAVDALPDFPDAGRLPNPKEQSS